MQLYGPYTEALPKIQKAVKHAPRAILALEEVEGVASSLSAWGLPAQQVCIDAGDDEDGDRLQLAECSVDRRVTFREVVRRLVLRLTRAPVWPVWRQNVPLSPFPRHFHSDRRVKGVSASSLSTQPSPFRLTGHPGPCSSSVLSRGLLTPPTALIRPRMLSPPGRDTTFC